MYPESERVGAVVEEIQKKTSKKTLKSFFFSLIHGNWERERERESEWDVWLCGFRGREQGRSVFGVLVVVG